MCLASGAAALDAGGAASAVPTASHIVHTHTVTAMQHTQIRAAPLRIVSQAHASRDVDETRGGRGVDIPAVRYRINILDAIDLQY